jgi:hypothetical protein
VYGKTLRESMVSHRVVYSLYQVLWFAYLSQKVGACVEH